MSELTNLTDRLSQLRESKDSSIVGKGNRHPPKKGPKPRKPSQRSKRLPERKFATDFFMIFVYALLAAAIICQFALIAFLDVI